MAIRSKLPQSDMMPLKVLFLLSDVSGSATYVRALSLSREIVSLGHDVTLMAVSPSLRFRYTSYFKDGVRFIETPSFLHNGLGCLTKRLYVDPGTGVLDILLRFRELSRGEYDIVQLFDHSLNVFLPWWSLKKKVKAKFVSDWCEVFNHDGPLPYRSSFRLDWLCRLASFPFRRLSRFLELHLRREVDGVTAVSEAVQAFAVDHGVSRHKVFVVEGGADTEAIRPLPKKEARIRLGLPAECRVVGFWGTFEQDLDVVIRSFAVVKQQVPDAYLLVIGGAPLKPALEHEGVSDSCIEAGHCSAELLPQFLACADVLILPLRDRPAGETRCPNRIGEYMACGRPIVVGNVGDTANVVSNNEIGLVAEPDVASFAESIVKLLLNPPLAQDMGRRARELVCSRYSWALQAAKLECIYFHLVASADRGEAPDAEAM